jgi:predicted RNase H-related nuclease YkuK (DUF458 family)
MQLTPQVDGLLSIHIDANIDERYKSTQYAQELVGLVMAQGFRAVLKPDSWCATTCADHVVRFHGKLPRSA